MVYLKATEAATIAQVDPATVYRSLKKHRATLLQCSALHLQGMKISPDGLRKMAELVGWSLDEAALARHISGDARQCNADNCNQDDAKQAQGSAMQPGILEKVIEQQARQIEALTDQMASMADAQREERHRHDVMIQQFAQQIRDQGKLIEDMRQAKPPASKSTPTKVTPIRQAEEKKEHPAKSWGPLKKAVVIMFAPHLLRGSGIRAA